MEEKSKIIELPKILDKRGNLSFIESLQHIPFEIKRAHWIYDVPGGQTRGGHAYIETQEFIVAMSGSFDVILHEHGGNKTVSLNRSYYRSLRTGWYMAGIMQFFHKFVGIGTFVYLL